MFAVTLRSRLVTASRSSAPGCHGPSAWRLADLGAWCDLSAGSSPGTPRGSSVASGDGWVMGSASRPDPADWLWPDVMIRAWPTPHR
jgi:hypothetical protein